MEEKKVEKKQDLMKIAEQTGMIMPKNMSDTVFNTLIAYEKNGQLTTPPNYSVENALKSAWLIIQQTQDKNFQPVLTTCTKESVANALLEMVIMGLNPAKSQCYFVPYLDKTGKAGKLTLMSSYFGKQMALKRVDGIESINAQVIYEGDIFTYDNRSNGTIYNIVHKQEFVNIDEDKLQGAYCVITYKGEEFGFVRTYKQIQEAWKGAKQKGYDKKAFRAEFSIRTVINLAVKHILQTTDDQSLLAETIINNENKHFEFDNKNSSEVEVVDETQKVISFETETVPHNEDTGEVEDCTLCSFGPCSNRKEDVDVSKASEVTEETPTPECFSDSRNDKSSFKDIEA